MKYLKLGLFTSVAVLVVIIAKIGFNIPPSDNSAAVIGSITKNTITTKNILTSKTEASFDLEIPDFSTTKEGKEYIKVHGESYPKDAWGRPVQYNAYQKFNKKTPVRKTSFLNNIKDFFSLKQAIASDQGTLPGEINCRTSTSVQGYFKVYFEEVAVHNGHGYDDSSFGLARRNEVCNVLQAIAHQIKLDTTNITPDILFAVDPGNLPSNALAAASAYSGYEMNGPDNGSLHMHIITRQDPTPNIGSFDAFVYTNFNSGINWDVDSNLNSGTYSLYTVMSHEIMHALGFRSLLPAVIYSTNIPIQHSTFDENFYQNSTTTNTNRFIVQGTNSIFNNILNVPAGAPSPWFVNNTDIYRGKKNIVNASFDGIRPVFSPLPWQQGSSLSHFDGTQYLMNPSLSTNTQILLPQNDEKEVLCHLGYQVLGMSGCVVPTPFANNDFKSTTVSGGGLPGTTCINILANDVAFSGGVISLNSLQVVDSQSGDILNYFSAINCTGSSSTTSNTNTKSIQLIPTSSTNSRIIQYKITDSISNRISFPATITFFSSVCSSNPSEYVCNGDFEQPFNPTFATNLYTYPGWSLFWCPFLPQTIFSTNNLINVCPVPFWTGDQIGTPDVFSSSFANSPYNSGFQLWSLPALGLNSPNGGNSISRSIKEAGGGYLPGGQFGPYDEPIITKLKNPLTPGQAYTVSFDVIAKYNPGYQDVIDANIVSPQGCIDLDTTWSGSTYSPTTSAPYYNSCQNLPYPSNDQWTHVSYTFTPTVAYQFLRGFGYFQEANQNIESSLAVLFDNFSIKPVLPATNSIKGIVYEDQNNNHIQDNGEQGLVGIHVDLFSSSSSTVPIQTASTDASGKYIFNNINNTNTYFPFDYVTLVPENIYQSVTQPVSPNSVSYGVYAHAYRFQFSTSGQNLVNKNFGVILNQGCVSTSSPSLHLSYPNGGEVFTVGQLATVTWVGCNTPATDKVKISLSLNGQAISQQLLSPTLGANPLPNTGSAVIKIRDPLTISSWGANAVYGLHYKILVQDVTLASAGNYSVWDKSDNLITVNP
ncbi:MAG: hypothetical protein NT068_02010 [Candidatus Nomurabacteria bacterium]|nr:hypothetical protein [Candidatus Nomurabacteria bacterium]